MVFLMKKISLYLSLQCISWTRNSTRCLASLSNIARLSKEMQSLIEKKNYQQIVSLFNQYAATNPEKLSSLVVNHVLKACTELHDLKSGSRIHRFILSKQQIDPRILTSLIQMYMQCGDVKTGESIFLESKEKTLPMYGALMKGLIKHGRSTDAIKIFRQIKEPNEFIYTLFFNACAQSKSTSNLDLIKSAQSKMSKIYYSNEYLMTSLIDALMKSGDVKNAEILFDNFQKKTLPMRRAMMKGYTKNNLSMKAIELFEQIKDRDTMTLCMFASACGELSNDDARRKLEDTFSSIPKSSLADHRLQTALIDGFIKCGNIEKGTELYNECSQKTASMHTVVMQGLIRAGQSKEAVKIFKNLKDYDVILLNVFFNACAQIGTQEILDLVKDISSKMPKSYLKNQLLLTSLFDAFIKCNDLVSSEEIFSFMQKTAINYGHLMNAFVENDQAEKALQLFQEMQKNRIELDRITYSIVIKALSIIGISETAAPIIDRIPSSFLIDRDIQNALINMWGKSGDVAKAKEIFDRVVEPDEVTYASMINSYGLNGMATEALALFNQTPPSLINEITYVCVLNACSHAGLANQAKYIFEKIQTKTQNIFCTMIDCLSRASQFSEAEKLIETYELDHEPVSSMYMAVLSGARNAKNKELSRKMFDLMKRKFPSATESITAATVLLANTYASSGDIQTASGIRDDLNQSGIKKKVGLSWSSVNGKIYQFRAHDRSHPRSSEIYAELERLSKELIENGHEYDSSWIVRPIQNDETVESILCGHSERLAIAWNFVENPNTKTIQITKNLRVCGDCHQATKLIARIRQCEIIVRDANRIHHFSKNGQCSCNDFF